MTTAPPPAEGPDLAAQARRARRFEAVLRTRMASEVRRLPFGTARLCPDLPLVYDASAVEVERPVALVELLDPVEATFVDAGLGHRRITTSAPEVAWTLVPALSGAEGWDVSQVVYMVHDRTTRPAVSPVGFEVVDVDTWLDHADAFTAEHDWGRSAAVQAAMAERDRRLADVVGTRFVLSRDGTAGCHVYRHGEVAQIEEVQVLSAARGQGLGAGLMAAAMAACEDASLVFLVADADDWPRRWYTRLGFTPVASAWAWSRVADGSAS
ncbi:GNAT family N-acetyltransferase [Euzebya sp.]|uniref:GNAT family N-acetyltransferase n=1 Tax=Euzebya sp. TaxID=1971409 RepID=UPI003515D1A1